VRAGWVIRWFVGGGHEIQFSLSTLDACEVVAGNAKVG
jgi:hypothetical protein